MKGLDRFKVQFVEAHFQVECAVCNTTSDHFPALEDTVFECPKCNRHFKFIYGARPMTQEEIDAHSKLKVPTKTNKISFNDLP